MIFKEDYWSDRYHQGNTQWDIGYVSTPLKEYLDQLEKKDIKILIPGSGNAYEAEYCHSLGFNNVFIIDIAKEPIARFLANNPTFPKTHVLHADFFELEDTFDLILEQTFFCALHPSQRAAYAEKMASLLNDGGKLVGVLFDIPLKGDNPPFGGNKEMYNVILRKNFEIKKMEKCYNSISPRAGNELFIHLIKK